MLIFEKLQTKVTTPNGPIVWMDLESTHTPKTRGKTLILVLWPQGVKAA